MILLTGVTGTTGAPLLECLESKGESIRAMVREPARVQQFSADKVEIVKGDYEDEASLASAMQGVEKAFMMMPNIETQLENEKRFIDVAVKNGVAHVVKLSASGADAGSSAILKSYHGQAEEYLAQSGLTYTNVRANFYMQNMMHSAATIVAEDKFYLPMRDGSTGLIDVNDVAAFIAEVLTGSAYNNRMLYITGSEILSFTELAEQMSGVLGRQISYVDTPPEVFRAELSKWSPGEWYMDAVMDLFELIASNDGANKTDTFREILGKPPRTFKQFVETHRAVFTP